MQDSLEDYIKIAGVGKDKQKLDTTKLAGIKATVDYKKRAEEYAQSIVEILIEGKLHPQIFLKSLNCINEDLYEDVVDERSITKLCGYPICGKHIPDMPEKKYIILAKVNKVYDLTERKKYCCNFCYKASSHIKKQIDDSPLWLRKPDTLYEYKLLPFTTAGLAPGEEIVNGVQPEAESADKEDEDVNFTSIAAFTEVCLGEVEDNLPDDDPDKILKDDFKLTPENIENEIKNIGKSILKMPCMSTIEENEFIQEDGEMPSTSKDCKDTEKKKVKFIDNIIVEPSPTKAKTKTEMEQEELKASIEKICKSLNIQLDLNKENDIDTNNQVNNKETKEDSIERNEIEQAIRIDDDKMNRVIQKVNDSERLKMKQPIRIDVTSKKLHKTEAEHLEAPPSKYAQRIIAIANKIPQTPLPQVKYKDALNNIIQKVKNIELNKKRKANVEDEKMRQILEKIQKKNTVGKKPKVIMVDTLMNPEVHRAHIEQHAKCCATTAMKTSLKTEECAQILSAFHKWLTLETFVFLYGEERVRTMVSSAQLDSYFTKLKVAELETSKQLKYHAICRRLQLKEVQDAKFDGGCMDVDGKHFGGALRPVPPFEALKEDVESMHLKAQAFYGGQIVVKSKKVEETALDVGDKEEEVEVVLPLVDVSNATAMRRSVFNKSILQYIKNHLYDMSLPESTQLQVQELIKTFKLEATNVVFKPMQWNIIALILINCLKKLDENLLSESQQYLETFNKKFNSNKVLLECDAIIEHFDTFIEDHILGNN